MPRGLFRVLVLMVFPLAACTTQPKSEKAESSNLTFEVVVRRADGAQDDAARPPADVQVWMLSVAGGIYGPPSGDPIIDSIVREGDQFGVALDTLERRLKSVAVAPKAGPVTYEPADTRVARLGTLAKITSEPDTNYIAGLTEKNAGRILILIYVDRPCTVRGLLSVLKDKPAGSGDAIVLSRSGLHWLSIDDQAPDVRHTSVVVPDGELVYALTAARRRPIKNE